MIRASNLRKQCFTLLFALCLPATVHAQEMGIESVAVLADASLSLPLTQIARDYSRKHEVSVVLTFATPQDETGQTAESITSDVLVTAKQDWIETLKLQGLVDIHAEAAVAGDRLALVGPPGSTLSADLSKKFPTAQLLKSMQLEPLFALPNPETLPDGVAAREALRHMGAAADLEPYTVYPKSREDLNMLILTQQAYGLTLETDARRQGVHIVGLVPENVYAPLTYRAVVLAGDNMDASRRFVEYLRSGEAERVLTEQGFLARK